MNYKHLIKRLKHPSIPDVRKLQEIRLNSIGKTSGDEVLIKTHYPKEYNIPRIITMPEEELRQVYSLALPLTFPLCDPFGYGCYSDGCKTDFFRWQGNNGALHLTTQKNLNKLIKLFSKNNVDIQVEECFGHLLDVGRRDPPGIVVPHSWYKEGYDAGKSLLEHQFVVFEDIIHACSYYTLKKEDSRTNKEEYGYENLSISLEGKLEKKREISCHIAYYTPRYFKPETFLPELIKNYEDNLRINHENDKNPPKIPWKPEKPPKEKETFYSLEYSLLGIGKSVELYNPSWIDKDIDIRALEY